MKKTIFRSLTLLLALTWLVPKADAQEYEFTLPCTQYEKPSGTNGWYQALVTSTARQAAVSSEGFLYVLNSTANAAGTTTGSYLFSSAGASLISNGMTTAGAANAFDDAGIYVYHAAGTGGPTQSVGSAPTKYRVKKPNASTGALDNITSYSYIEPGSYAFGRVSFYIDVTGSVLTTTGGHIWTAPGIDAANILAIEVVSGNATKKLTFDISSYATPGANDNVIQFYDTSDKTAYKCMMQLRGVGIYDVTLNLNTQKVVSCNKISDSNVNCNSLAANIFTMAGRKFLVRNTRATGSSPSEQNLCTGFEVLDITDSYTSPAVIGTRDPFPSKSAGYSTGSYIQTRKVSDTHVEIYAFSPGQGAAMYNFTATLISYGEDATNVKAVCEKDEVYIGKQNTTISWTAPANAVSYDVYYQTWNDYAQTWYDYALLADDITATSYVHQDVKMYYRNDNYYDRDYRYKVVVNYASGTSKGAVATDASDASIYPDSDGDVTTVTPILVPIAVQWDKDMDNDPAYMGTSNNGIRNFSGYCKTELFYETVSYGLKPAGYIILRDGEVLNRKRAEIPADEVGLPYAEYTKFAAYNFVDTLCMAGKTYDYKIVSCYNKRSETAESAVATEVIGVRDWSKPTYSITPIYNVPIDPKGAEPVNIKRNTAVFPSIEYPLSEMTSENSKTQWGYGYFTWPHGNFSDPVAYKQGVFRDGKWYIAQMSTCKGSGPSASSDGTWNDGRPLKGDANIRGGIIMFDAYTEEQIKAGSTGYYFQNDAYISTNTNAGVAMDEGGNMFFRGTTSDFANRANNTYYANQDFVYRMTRGYVLPKGASTPIEIRFSDKSGGAFGTDHLGINFGVGGLDGSIDAATKTVNSVVQGRVDYFNLTGDMSSTEGAYLYIAPTGTNAVWVLNLKLNAAKTAVTTTVVSFTDMKTDAVGKQYMDTYTHVENWAYPVLCNGREGEFIHQVRSRAHLFAKNDKQNGTNGDLSTYTDYWGDSRTLVNAGAENGSYKASVKGGIYSTLSRINSAGGCTLEFNDELFVISPMGQFSINQGDIYVGMAMRETGQLAKDADIMHVIPATFYSQGEDQTGAYSDANGMWLHAEVPDVDFEVNQMGYPIGEVDSNGDGVCDYAYIYQYVPGIRFAKYRLSPNTLYPPSPVTVEINPVYSTEKDDEDKGTDLERYDAEMTWEEVNGYGTSEGGNVYYNVDSYTFGLVDNDGNPVVIDTTGWDEVLAELYVYDDAGNVIALKINTDRNVYEGDGNVDEIRAKMVTYGEDGKVYYKGVAIPGLTYENVTDENGNLIYNTALGENSTTPYRRFTFVYEDVDAYEVGEDGSVSKNNYTAQVQVGYAGITDVTMLDYHQSEITYDNNENGFDAVAPGATVTTTSTTPQGNDPVNNEPYNQWADWNGNGEKDKDDGYWMVYDVTIDIDEPETDEPVSYYVVEIDKDGDGTPDETVTVTEDGTYTLVNGTPYEGYEDGTGAGMIPGTYDFQDDTLEPGEEDVITFTVWDYVGGTDFNTEKGEPQDDVTNEQKKPGEWTYTVTAVYAGGNEKITQEAATTVDTSYDGTTAVEVIGVDTYFSVYPVPASVSVTIKSSEAIEDVAIYTIAGVEVKAIDGNGANVMNVEVEDLAAGYYLLKVNDRAPVKIVVK